MRAALPLAPGLRTGTPSATASLASPMAQAFTRQAVLVIKLTALALALLVIAATLAWRWSTVPRIAQDEPVHQPIPFSHKHHVSDDGIDCRYCHTTVETSASAGMPSTSICLNCHTQLYPDAPALAPLHASLRDNQPIRWTRVHKLPDFVYFDHSIHVNKGVSCIECHGPVDQMPLTRRVASLDMQWCVACHRDPQHHLRPPGQVVNTTPMAPLSDEEIALLRRLYNLQDTRRLTDCSTCHR